jgi:hypothetical protein
MPNMLPVKRNFYQADFSFMSGIQTVQRITVQTFALAITSAIYLILPSISDFFSQLRNPNCLSKDCPDLPPATLHSREVDLYNAMHPYWSSSWDSWQEQLRFRKDDSRDKLLFVSAEADHNEALQPFRISSVLNSLDKEYDIKYTVVRDLKEICREIKESSLTGELKHVIISDHGNPFFIELADASTSIT